MKKVKYSLNSLLAKIYAGCLVLLGFGCESSSEPCMYGTPTGDFEIKGMVTSEDDQAVPDATVRVTKPDMPSGIYSIETTKTDKDGKYTLKGVDFPTDMKVVCIPDNPMLEADSTIVELDYKKDPKDKNTWNRGHAEATVDFRLKKR